MQAVDLELRKSELQKRITNNFQSSINVKSASMASLKQPILAASKLIYTAVYENTKILCCGIGESAVDCQRFATELVTKFEVKSKPPGAIYLSADTSTITSLEDGYNYDSIFARQVQALGKPRDILVAICPEGNSRTIIKAIETAQKLDMKILFLTGNNGGEIAKTITHNDIAIKVPSTNIARIQETHILAIHCICDALEWLFKNTKENEII